MSEYLSKEEIKQWRSSLEKITLEEFAARLGKTIAQEKQTNDIVDIVMKDSNFNNSDDWKNSSIQVERITSIAQRAFEREKEIAPSAFSIDNIVNKKPVEKKPASTKKEQASAKITKTVVKQVAKKSLKDKIEIVLNKNLTDREQKVFDYFAQNSNKVVYAKDLAELLDLPRDYVYKYIKNLRNKIEGGNLQNAENGGFILLV